MCLKARAKKNMWYLDSGCSHHMTENKTMFSQLIPKNGGIVTFGDNAKGKTIGEGKIGKAPNTTIDNVLLIDGLKHNLLSISQFCDKNYKFVFEPNKCIVHNVVGNVLFTGMRQNNSYFVDLSDSTSFNETWVLIVNNDAWLWHRRLGYASMHTISKLSRKYLVKDLPNIKFEKDLVCEACVKGKNSKSSFSMKKIDFYHKTFRAFTYRLVWSL